jgi:hypothetical protein
MISLLEEELSSPSFPATETKVCLKSKVRMSSPFALSPHEQPHHHTQHRVLFEKEKKKERKKTKKVNSKS